MDDILYSVATPRERALRRARLAGLEIVACELCGGSATVERLRSSRPNQPAKQQTVIRCLEKEGCPVQVREEVVHEAPLEGDVDMDSSGNRNGGPQADPQTSEGSERQSVVQKEEHKVCECGCGRPVADDGRFFSRGCLGRYARQFRGRKRPNGISHAPQDEDEDELVLVYDAMRSLRRLPPAARRKAIELLESLEDTGE
ncbi:MAG: hypothetical protein HY319_10010 [Armatimonadetes bacterium]|nr:hypothetical protein [Armatimonadota bacterium]